MATRFMNHHNKQWEELGNLSEDYEPSWEDYLISLDLEKGKVQNLISELSECRCCERHQCGRPSHLCQVVTHSPGTEDNRGCACPCRHNIRSLCRVFCPQGV